jgi:NTP pyrophosphatase (non-canonical NTP hydrolase)
MSENRETQDENRETQATIGQWARETFPGGDDLSPRHCFRLLEEVVELCLAAGASHDDVYVTADIAGEAARKKSGAGYLESRTETPERIAEEMADCAIVLDVLAERRGIDLRAEVDKKMIRNRRRAWKVNEDGTGYHTSEGDDSASAPEPDPDSPSSPASRCSRALGDDFGQGEDG